MQINCLRDASNIRAWLYKVMKKRHIDKGRKEACRIVAGPLVGDEDDPSNDLPEVLRTPNPEHWMMELLGRSTDERKAFFLAAVEEQFDKFRLAERRRKEGDDRSLEERMHSVRRDLQNL